MSHLNQPVSQLKTQFEMKEIIERCFEELERSGAIKRLKDITGGYILCSGEDNPFVFKDASQLADHISKTLIGEILEFEIIRRQAAVYREIPRIEADLRLIESKVRDHDQFWAHRIDKK